MSETKIGFIGGGRVARILLGGWSKAGELPTEIVASDPEAKSLERLTDAFPNVCSVGNDNAATAGQDVVFLAVHPPVVGEVLASIKNSLKPNAILVSLAPKLTIDRLSNMLDGFTRIARLIPNAPTIVGKGFNPIAFSPSLTEQDRDDLTQILIPLGEAPEVAEDTLEIYAILTAMGPTYLWPQLYELQSLAQSFGLNSEDALTGLVGMVRGTLATMTDAKLSPDEVQDLIPVKPLADLQPALLEAYRAKLGGVMERIRP